MAPIGWGIIGCGDVVSHKSGPALLQSRGSEIRAVMRRNADAARAYVEANCIPKWTSDAADILGASDIDIVYIATPPSTHLEYVLAAARAGKHVLVEKPMALHAAEAEAMCRACQEAGVQLFVSYYRRYQPHVRHLRRLIRKGVLGESVQAIVDIAAPTPEETAGVWRTDPKTSGGGIFVDIGSHRLDVLVCLLGAPIEVTGFAKPLDGRRGIEGTVALALRFPNGVLATVTGDFQSGRSADRLELYGTQGKVIADPLDAHVFSLYSDRKSEIKVHRAYPAPHFGLVAHIESVLRGESENGASGREGLETERILDLVRLQVGAIPV